MCKEMEIVIDVNNTSYSFNSFFQINHVYIRKPCCLEVLAKPYIVWRNYMAFAVDEFAVTVFIEMK